MDVRTSNIVSYNLLAFLKHCYRFLNVEWPHATREPIPDQGFEETFRASCVSKLPDWRISQIREMQFGENLTTGSGTNHEIDLVGLHDQVSAVVELKHWESSPPTKNEVIVFFAKILDYVAANPQLALKDLCPIFVSAFGFEESGLAACLGLGVHPIGPGLRPLPIVIDTLQIIDAEVGAGASVDAEFTDQLAELWTLVRFLSTALEGTWVSSRWAYLSDNAIVVRAVTCLDSVPLSRSLRKGNGQCSHLLTKLRALKAAVRK
jgi:hypothetical protein